jgi:hypothetical protein
LATPRALKNVTFSPRSLGKKDQKKIPNLKFAAFLRDFCLLQFFPTFPSACLLSQQPPTHISLVVCAANEKDPALARNLMLQRILDRRCAREPSILAPRLKYVMEVITVYVIAAIRISVA